MKYEIWQLTNSRDVDYFFGSWEEAEGEFSITHYHNVYSGEMEQKNILDNLYEKFNIDRPDDFRGHSLSVSDVIALKGDDKDHWRWYYCDSFGWKEITEIVQPIMY